MEKGEGVGFRVEGLRLHREGSWSGDAADLNPKP